MKKLILSAGLVSLLSINAFAGETYGFLEAGQSKLDIDAGDFSIGKTDNILGIGLGYKINPHVAVEAAYRDLGGISSKDEDGKTSLDATALQVSVLGLLPISDKFDLYGRLGYGHIKATGKYVDCCDSFYNESDCVTENKAVFGFGGEYKFTENLAARLEYSQFAKIDEVTLSSTTLAVTLTF